MQNNAGLEAYSTLATALPHPMALRAEAGSDSFLQFVAPLAARN